MLKRFISYGLSLGLGIAWAGATPARLIYRDPRPFNVTYTFELEPEAADIDRAKDLKVWLPLPRDWESQKAVKILSITPAPDATLEDPEFGNRIAFWNFGRGPQMPIYKAQVRFRLEAHDVDVNVDPAKVRPYDKSSAEYRLYTRSERMNWITPKVREFAREAIGDETNPYLQARRIAQFVYHKVRYKILDYERGRGIQSLLDHPETDSKTGEVYYEGSCTQRSTLVVAMCRAVGIPARSVMGFVGWYPWLPLKARYDFETKLLSGKLAGAQYFGHAAAPHMWTEFYIPGYGWIPDDYWARPYSERLVLSKGRDIKIGPISSQERRSGYGSQFVLMDGDRADSIFYAVWNIAKIRKARIRLVIEPDPFPAEEFAEYASLFRPATDFESLIRSWRTGALRKVYRAIGDNQDRGAALAAEFKKSGLGYQCGAYVLEMLRKQVGEEKFFKLYQDYVERRVRSGALVSTAKFQELAEKVYGKPLDWFFRQWATLTNLPTLKLDRVTAAKQGPGWRVRGHLLQTGDSIFRLSVPLVLRAGQDIERKEMWLETRDSEFEFQTIHQPRRLLVDPDLEVLKIQKTAPHLTHFWDAHPNLLLIYGTLAEAAVNKAAAERFNDDYLELDASKIKADSDVTEDDLKAPCLCLFGRTNTNKIAQRFRADFPIQVEDDHFVWQGTTYRRPTQGVVEAIEPSGGFNRLILLYAGLGAEAMKALGDMYLYDPDSSYVIFDRDKQVFSGDWEGADPNLVWDFPSKITPP